ncbi:hypothetical protein DICPUDRAFT_85339 [Dictyostelium purpureum]|uniref:Uncharacterized protein n=1 Tax=Dictyostelium purpureum TaxID=5786 RepID=F1A5F1_DICPU|nr:uncharacterized protein DICPUDRAFT_85339 [Dictyostelium purpureum]EGC28578.1 hypothetical protein DICPUDRAFT_85339 [Dictyostelium purpureum]|eukprot:XP_003294894.1 hypothetical protein DICPUDRAFT_85339 [Dictyostelium purpureum]
MELINYFRIKSLIEVSITERLIYIFKHRYKVENSIEWVNSSDNANYIIDCLEEDIFENFTLKEREVLRMGILERFSFNILINLLLYSNYQIIKKELLGNQNDLINSINIVLTNINNFKEYKICEKNYVGLKNIIQETIEKLSLTNSDMEELTKPSESMVEENNQRAKDYIAWGNENMKNGNFNGAYSEYNRGLALKEIPTDIKSILHLKCGISLFELAKECGSGLLNGIISTDNKEYEYIIKSKSHVVQSIIYQPEKGKSYFRMGVILSKLSCYEKSNDFFESCLLLQSNEQNQTLIGKIIQENKAKLSVIKRALKNNNGVVTRDFEEETSILLNEYFNYSRLVSDNFKEKLSNDFFKSFHRVVQPDSSKLFDLSKDIRIAIQANIYLQVSEIIEKIEANSPQDKEPYSLSECYSILKRFVASDTKLSGPYFLIVKSLVHDQPSIKILNTKLILALIMKITTFPVPFTNVNCSDSRTQYKLSNFDVANMNEFLGSIYKFGGLNQDIDIEKAKYYYQKSIHICQNSIIPNSLKKDYGSTANAYYSIGFLGTIRELDNIFKEDDYYLKNFTEIEKSCLYWKMGSELLQTQYSSRCYEKYLKYSIIINNKEKKDNISKDINIPIIRNIDLSLEENINSSSLFSKELLKEYAQPIDFNNIKEIVENNTSENEYALGLYKVYSSFNCFISSFQQVNELELERKEYLMEEKYQLIKILADLYCKIDYLYVLRVPPDLIVYFSNFLDRLIKEKPNDQRVNICYIGFNRFNKLKYQELLQIIELSAPSVSSSEENPIEFYSQSFQNQYNEALAYYSVIIHSMNNQIDMGLRKALMYELEFVNSSYIFNFFIFNILFEFGEQKSITDKILFHLYENGQEYIISNLSSSHPYRIHYLNLISIILFNQIQKKKNQNQDYQSLNEKLNEINLLIDNYSNLKSVFFLSVHKEKYYHSKSILNNLLK